MEDKVPHSFRCQLAEASIGALASASDGAYRKTYDERRIGDIGAGGIPL